MVSTAGCSTLPQLTSAGGTGASSALPGQISFCNENFLLVGAQRRLCAHPAGLRRAPGAGCASSLCYFTTNFPLCARGSHSGRIGSPPIRQMCRPSGRLFRRRPGIPRGIRKRPQRAVPPPSSTDARRSDSWRASRLRAALWSSGKAAAPCGGHLLSRAARFFRPAVFAGEQAWYNWGKVWNYPQKGV